MSEFPRTDWIPETPPSNEPAPRVTRAPKLGACVECSAGLYMPQDAGRGLCFHCYHHKEEIAETVAEAARAITREEALAELRSMAGSANDEDAHMYADSLLLRLIGDPDIAAAWAAVPKWYA